MNPGTWEWCVASARQQTVVAEWIARRPGLADKKCFSYEDAEAATYGVKGATIESRVIHLSGKGGAA